MMNSEHQQQTDTALTIQRTAVRNPTWECPSRPMPTSGDAAAVLPGCRAIAYNDEILFSVSDISSVCGMIRSVTLLCGAHTYKLEKKNEIYSLSLSTRVLLGDAHAGIVSYAFAVSCTAGLYYLLRDKHHFRTVIAPQFDAEKRFSCTIYRRFSRTPDWFRGAVLFVPPPKQRGTLIADLPTLAERGITCIAPYNAPQDGETFYLPEGTEEMKRLIDAAGAYDIGILGLIDFSDERAGILTVCRHAEELLSRGCAGFFFRGLAAVNEGFFQAFCHHIRRFSESCILLGDEATPDRFLPEALLDCQVDIALSEALMHASQHGDAAILEQTLTGIYRRYPSEISHLLPLICTGNVPSWMRILQYTLPGIPTLLEESVSLLETRLALLRREKPALRGGFRCTMRRGGMLSFIRSAAFTSAARPKKGTHLVVSVNLSDEPETMRITHPVRDLLSGRAHAISVPIPPRGGVILEKL